ncbi:hypothetical protein CUS_6015 [Ruminococcus albus 8]|uniref:Uncharacterized protein n=1 Tax=Ruminococcus albus 8 TaxID=246199 RepID=E9SD04_RUMAL|nr:hypothetical protein CUS_6015 [Ruminococcus albus 8]
MLDKGMIDNCYFAHFQKPHFILYDYPFSTPAENAVNKRIIEHHTPTTLSSVKPPFLWCVSGITTLFYHHTVTHYRHVGGA